MYNNIMMTMVTDDDDDDDEHSFEVFSGKMLSMALSVAVQVQCA